LTNIVAIGGGTGLSTLLRGLKHHTEHLTAIVTIADDGGSSGRLRAALDMPPAGDARKCLVALSRAEPLMAELLDYRFQGASSLNGHSLGNLLLAALYQMRGGFREGLAAAAELLAIQGQVVPVSDQNGLTLLGETVMGGVVRGESAVGHAPGGLRRVWLEPPDARASDTATEAVRQADLIVIGPGSLYTSIIPNFLVWGLSQAVNISKAPTVFVCNVATQPHETDGHSVAAHLGAFWRHSGVGLSHVVINSNRQELPEGCGQEPVEATLEIEGYSGELIYCDVVDPRFPTRHDPERLAKVLMELPSIPMR